MREMMDMQGLLAVMEADEVDLLGRKETRFSPVPLIGVQIEVQQHSDPFSSIILRLGWSRGWLRCLWCRSM